MAKAKRTEYPVSVEANDEELEGAISYGVSPPGRLVLSVYPRDKRKKIVKPWPIRIEFQNPKDAFELLGRAVSWLGKQST